jgi:hypothetical protein
VQGTARAEKGTAQAADARLLRMIQTATAMAAWTPTPTYQPFSSGAGVPDLAKFEVVTATSISPDGEWVVEKMMAFPTERSAEYGEVYLAFLKVASADGRAGWVVVDEWSHFGLGYPQPEVLGWSLDGRYLYMADVVFPDGCPPPGGWQEDLRRVDLQDGQVELLTPGWSGPLALSPLVDRVAAFDRETSEVILIDLKTQEEQRLPFEPGTDGYWDAGGFVWSPAGNALAFTVLQGDFCGPPSTSILRVHLPSGSIRMLVEKDERAFFTQAWELAGKILLVDKFGQDWQLDLTTGELARKGSG